MELFLNPWYMVAGGALVSSPILIHLINRMRFKRIRWAAMEFLLKSQKRNRRRLIIEQMILLMLRCLLVLLAALLVARYVGSALGITPTSSTTHVVLLDDTVSMTDRTPRGQSPGPDCFAFAKEQVQRLARFASEANSTQRLVVLPLSNPKQKLFEDTLNKQGALDALHKALDEAEPTAMHGDTLAAVEAARKEMGEARETKRWLHVVSDFRDTDWGRAAGTERLHEVLKEITETGANVTLIDTAAPSRPTVGGKQVEHHNNYAVTDLRPEKRIAPGGTIVPFTVDLENFGSDSREQIFLEVYLNGKQDFEASRFYPAPPPGGRVRHSFDMLFEGPGETQKAAFHRVTAKVMAAQGQALDVEAGLAADNVRHAVIEIRKDVPTLVIDGSAGESKGPGSDIATVRNALESAKGNEAVKVVVSDLTELARPDLEREYATIYFLNVENLRAPKGKDGKGDDLYVQRLREFVRKGGNVVFFTGDKVDVAYYNKTLFEDNQGLFPVPLEAQSSERLSDDEIDKRRGSSAPKIFVLETDHEVTRGIAPLQFTIPDLIIPQHTPTKDRFEWPRPWSQAGDLKELITLANLKPLDDNARSQMNRLLKRLPINEPAFKQYRELLQKHHELVRGVAGDARKDEMFKVAEALDAMLNERGAKPGEKDNVSLVDFWALPESKDLKADILNFRKDALYGSPLILTRKVGKGNVAAFLTTPGTKWSGWSGGRLGGVASFTFPMVMVDLQKFLTRGGDAGSRLVGDAVSFALDEKQYQGKVQRVVQIDEGQADLGRPEAADPTLKAPAGMQAEPERTAQAAEGKYSFAFENTKRTGVHVFRLFPQGKEPEERWFAFNVDADAESNLRRVYSDDLVRGAATEASATRGTMKISMPDEIQDELRERKADLSEMPWLFLLFLVVLVVEQALAVHLSFHVKGGEAAQGAPAAAAQPSTPAAA